jgi:hypothetical protein
VDRFTMHLIRRLQVPLALMPDWPALLLAGRQSGSPSHPPSHMVGVQRKPIWRHTRRSRTKFMWSWVKNPTVVNRLVFLLFSRAFELSPRNPPRWGAVRLISAKLVVLGLSSESRLFMKSCWTLLRCTVSFLGNETRENPWFSKKYYANMQCSASKSETMQGTRSAMMHLCIFFFEIMYLCLLDWHETPGDMHAVRDERDGRVDAPKFPLFEVLNLIITFN